MTRRPPMWLMVMITISGTIGMHMFLPALPAAAQDLGTGATQMQLTISVYIVGLALGQLVYGPLSDAWGRRRVLLSGMVLYVLGSVAAALAPNVSALLWARIAQSLGGCAGVAIGRAIVRDSSTVASSARNLGILAMMMTFSPVIAPMIGGAVTAAWGWRAIFVLLSILGALTMVLIFVLLAETGRPSGQFQMAGAMRDYRELLTSRHYVCFALGTGVITTSVFAFLTAAPFIITQELHQPVQMAGVYSGAVLLGAAAGNGVSAFLSRRVHSQYLLRTGAGIALVCACIYLAMVLTHHLAVWPMTATVLLFSFGIGFTNPAAIGRAMDVNPRLFGSATGLWGCLQMGAGSVSTSLTALGSWPALAAGTVMLGAILFGLMCFELGLRSEHAVE